MVKREIVLGHEISRPEIEVNKTKVEVIAKLSELKCIKDIRSFLGHIEFYRRFIKEFSKIAKPLMNLLAKNVPFYFDDGYLKVWNRLNKNLSLLQSYRHLIRQNHLRLCAMPQILLLTLCRTVH